LNELRIKVTKACDTFAYATMPLALTDLESIDRQLTAAEAQLRSAKANFEVLETAFDELIAAAKPQSSGPTLNEALAALEVQAAESLSQAVKEKKQELKDHFAEEIKSAKQDLKTLHSELNTAQSELKKVETDAGQQLVKDTDQRTELLRKLTQQRIAARKQMEEALPEFRDRLSPFIKSGYRQPNVETHFVATTDSRPISYSALLSVGALEGDLKGLETLFHLGAFSRFGGGNDRPRGSFPEGNWEFEAKKPETIRQLKAIQEFLRRHGEAMVEAKLLIP
jgi:hypothetical protein